MKPLLATITATGLFGLSWMAASACALDNVPSISLDHRLAIHNHNMPRNLSMYAPFVFRNQPRAGRRITLAENKKEVAKSLTEAAMSHRPRWYFGDGSKPTYGWSVHHRYSHKGRFKITVDAYYAKGKQWFAFDDAVIRVRARAR